MIERYRREFSLLVVMSALLLLLAVAAPGFFAAGNLRDVAIASAPVLIVALGMALVMITGNIDISVGSQFAICGVAAGVLARMGLPVPLAMAAASLLGAAMGALNGVLVAWAGIPSIVVTLATMVALRDGLRWVTQGEWVQGLPAGFHWFGLSQTASEVITIGAALLLTAAAWWSLGNLAAARMVYATGSDAGAARLAGIDTGRVVFAVFTLTGALTGCAAALNAVRFQQVPANAGVGIEMKVIAAAVVGGVAISGGRGGIAGVLLGVWLLAAVSPALTFLGLSAYWERAIEGAIILAAVAVDAIRIRTRGARGKEANAFQ